MCVRELQHWGLSPSAASSSKGTAHVLALSDLVTPFGDLMCAMQRMEPAACDTQLVTHTERKQGENERVWAGMRSTKTGHTPIHVCGACGVHFGLLCSLTCGDQMESTYKAQAGRKWRSGHCPHLQGVVRAAHRHRKQQHIIRPRDAGQRVQNLWLGVGGGSSTGTNRLSWVVRAGVSQDRWDIKIDINKPKVLMTGGKR